MKIINHYEIYKYFYFYQHISNLVFNCDTNNYKIIISAITIAQNSHNYWSNQTYYNLLTRYISTTSMPFIYDDIILNSDNNQNNNDSTTQKLVQADTKGGVEAAMGYIGTGLILTIPFTWEEFCVTVALGAIISSVDANISIATNTCLAYIDENNDFLLYDEYEGYNYLRATYIESPEHFYSICNGKFAYLVNLFNISQ